MYQYRNIFRQSIIAGAIAALIAMIIVYTLAGGIYQYSDSVQFDHPPEVDVIICLGGGRGRLTAAGELWYRYWQLAQEKQISIPILYLSGMGPQANWTVLSRQIRPAILQKIRPENVIIEKESSNTDANARWFARYAQPKQWHHVLLVTSSYHMKRAHYIFNRVLNEGLSKDQPPIAIETLSIAQDPFTPQLWRSEATGIRVTLWEYFKWVYYYLVWKPRP